MGREVFLRAPGPADYEEWAVLRERSRDFLSPWEPAWGTDDLTRAAYRRRLERYAADRASGAALPMSVFRVADGALVGGCNLANIRRGVSQAAAIGYWVGERYKRRGYTREAVRCLVRHGFNRLDLHRIEAACLPENRASRGLLADIGFAQEGDARSYLKINGEWRDHVLYAIVRGDVIG